MKPLIKYLIMLFNLKTTRLYYEVQRFRQIKSLRPRLDHPKYKDILHTLDREGIVIQENFMTKEECDVILAALEQPFQQVKDGTYQGPFQYDHNKLIRLARVDQYVEATRKFFHNPFFDELAKAYIDPRAYSYRQEAELRDNVGVYQQGDVPHFDDWRLRFKYFLYLTDVGPENAPFTFYKNTHRDESWKKKKNFEYERDGQYGAYGHFHPQEMLKLKQDGKLDEVVCTGKAGTLIIADFRGIHCGTRLISGRRILLNSTYGI